MVEQLKFLVVDFKRWKCSSFKDLYYMFFEQGIWGTVFYRISRALFLINVPVVKILLRFISFFIYKFSESVFGVAIAPRTEIGPGLYIGHAGMIFINEEVKAGKNLSIGPGVLIGMRGGGSLGVPVIGDDVYIGVGAKILGKITVGNNVRIGANSVVVGNVPGNVTMFGVPAKIVGPVFNFKKKKDQLMDGMIVHHYGLATNDLQGSADVFHSLGYSIGDVFIDPVQKVKLLFVSRPGEPMIEIICDLDETGPTKNIISKSGNGFYHVCYEVNNIEESIGKLRDGGFMLRHKPVAATAFQGRKIAWMYNRSVGLVELLEK